MTPPPPTADAALRAVTRERFARVEALFLAALEQPTDRRGAWLAAACGDDEAALAEVEELLAVDARPAVDRLRPPAERLLPDDELAPGALIDGRYRVGERLGAGGLGVVHRAEQLEPVRRVVALKVGRRGLDAAAALALFQAERRALALVSHPGIAQVFDAGRTARGRFYVAMELVEGEPMTSYCARHGLDLDARLGLFIDVCRAVQHAHQRGVIHRDLKPSNVLVTRHGDVAWPKVIDFGVAHATGADALPVAPAPVAGTPAYMSPEQATDAADVDTRADVYSLGVMLYELLTGVLPFPSPGAPRDLPNTRAVPREPPLAPSARVRTPAHPDDPSPTVPPIAARALRSDLDPVVARAMAHDRTARYATVSELAADVDRARRRLPVSARRPTAAYLLHCFVRRHRLLVAAFALLVAGAGVAGVATARLAEQRQIAEREAAAAEVQREIAARTSRLAERLRARSLLNAAAAGLASGDAGTTRANLDAIPTAHRGWEWRYLHLEADRSDVTLTPSGPAITALTVDAAGATAGDAHGWVRRWPFDADAPIRALHAHDGAVAALAVSPGGQLVATTDLAHASRTFDLEGGALLWERPGVVSLGRGAFSPDGARLALGVFGAHAVSIHDSRSGEELARIPVVMPTAYRPTWVGEDSVLVTDLSRTLRLDLERHDVAWITPARLVAPAGSDHFVARTLPNYIGWGLFDATTGEALRPLGEPAALTDVLDTSPGGVASAWGGATTALALATSALGASARAGSVEELPGHDGAITAIAFTAGGQRVFTGDAAGAVKGWNTATSPQPYVAPRSNDAIFVGRASRDGAVVVTGGWGAVTCWDAVLGVERWTRLVGRAYVHALALDPTGATVAVADWRGVVRVLDLGDGAERARVDLDAVRIFALAWAPDGRLVVGREDGRLDLVDLERRAVDRTIVAHGSAVRALAFAPGGDLLASGSGDGAALPVINEERLDGGADASVRLWRWPGLEPVVVMPGHGASVRSLAFAPDGARLVSGGSDRTVKAWSVPDGALQATRVGVGHEVTAVGFTADGARMVTAHGEGPLLVWDAAELELLTRLPGGHGDVLWAGFTADGKTLTAVSRERAVVRFETDRDPARQRVRDEVRAARAALDSDTDALSAEESAKRVTARADLSPAVAARAAAMARARGDHALMLNSAAWGRVLTPGQDPSEVARAVEQSVAATRARPGDWQLWNTLALARYRSGDLSGALVAADRCADLQRAAGIPTHPADNAVATLILAGLGRHDEARERLEVARSALARDDVRLDHETWALFAEAEVALGRPPAPR